MDVVHLCDWVSQPDIRIACTKTMTTPMWGRNHAGKRGKRVFLSDADYRYTFDKELVTCPKCKQVNP